MNEGPEPGPEGPPQPSSRKLNWTPVSLAEISLFVAVLIYEGIHRVSNLKELWKIPTADTFVPEHPIAKVMPYNRFQAIYCRLRIYDKTLS